MSYVRLLVMHLGLPHWQYAFTDVGLNPTAKVKQIHHHNHERYHIHPHPFLFLSVSRQQWFRFMAPERLAIDLNHSRRTEDREEATTMLMSHDSTSEKV